MDPELILTALQLGEKLAERLLGHAKLLQIGEAAAEAVVKHFQDIQSAISSNDQAALDAIRQRLDAEADALARPPG